MTEHQHATGAVVDFIVRARWGEFPSEAVALAKRCVVDGLGVMLAGSTTSASAILRDYVGTENPAGSKNTGAATSGESTVFGPESFRTSAANAALLNGTSGHALDYDDTQLATSADRIFGLLTHPTMPPLAAALALGERQRVSGAAFLEAFLVGFELECKIAEAIHPHHYKKGFHSSGTVGTFGSMAAAAKLLGLNRDATTNALAIAASLAAGIRVNFGSMTKPLHVGRAAQNGIVAAELAARGFTGGRDALDPPWGFFQAFSFGDGFDADRIVARLGNPYTIVSPGVSIKPYPCGVLGHPTMDAMRRLVMANDVKPEQIAAIRVRAGSNILNPLRYSIATNELEAKFCPAFMVASIALRRKAGIHEFTDEFVQSAPVQRMMSKVERVLDPEIEARGFEKIRSTVEVDLKDGRRLVEHADERYRGGPDRPFTREELHDKYAECAGLVLSSTGIDETFRMVESLDTLADLTDLVRSLSGSVAGTAA
ncbi:MAG TPA: MmgE/PrpD family protein [Vicinamibacterales bacterium]|nr:MmgE/PrpD family protein [Vicinamibacterales bacterium]